MRVLFFGADPVSAPVRIRPLLQSLSASGGLERFACVDRDMTVEGADAAFDVVLVHRNPGRRQIAWLRRSGLPFVYDIDDLLLLREAAGLDRRRAKEQDAIRWCLANAAAVTAPSRRLLKTLEARLGMPLAARSVLLPNAGFEPRNGRAPDAQPRLLWVSSAGQHYDELLDVGSGVVAAARAIGTDVILVGRFSDALRKAVPGHSHVPWVEPQQFRRFLIEGPYVATAPLPVALPADDQEFVNCKSDIKAAQFCSLGIAALYSAAPPYTESDLPCALSPTNSAADWRDRLIDLAQNFPESGQRLALHPALPARSTAVLARQFFDVLSRVRAATGARFAFKPTRTPPIFRRIEQKLRSIRTRYLRR